MQSLLHFLIVRKNCGEGFALIINVRSSEHDCADIKLFHYCVTHPELGLLSCFPNLSFLLLDFFSVFDYIIAPLKINSGSSFFMILISCCGKGR